MKYKYLFVEHKKLYSIGINEETNEYVLMVIVPSTVWYSRYFRISKEEFDYFNSDKKHLLDELAHSCSYYDISENKDRFIHSDLSIENKK